MSWWKTSYLVSGAKLRCIWGSKPGKLIISDNNNYSLDDIWKACYLDCKKEQNITDFGKCLISEDGKTCKERMLLTDKWENTGGTSWKLEKLNEDTALTMDSVLLCKKGGMIVPETSGQGDVREINWEQLLTRYQVDRFIAAYANGGCIYDFEPINLNTGNFIYEKEDLVIRGITTLSFHITYNSMEEYRGGSVGEGWHHNYEIYIKNKKEGMLDLHLGDGRVISYRRSFGDIYTPLYNGTGLIKQEADGYHYAAGEGMEYTFDGMGRLLTRKDRNGNTDRFLYNSSGQLSEARGANGGSLYYRYNKEGNLYNVCDHTGREVCLRYSYRVLYQYINPSGHAYTYGYNENLRLESVTTPRGIEGVRNVYDGANRVAEQITPDGSVVKLRYDDEGQCTYAKDQNGYITAYESDDRFRNIRTIYKDGEERFAYNDNNQRTLYVDKNGNQTRYRYDDQGRLTGITDALGRQASYTYNGEGKLLTASIDGNKFLENTYDKAGHLIKTTDALGRSRETAYDGKGLPEQITLPDGSKIRIAHDERGNISSITDPYNVTISYEYDALNRVTAVTDNEGNRTSYRYDERDHLLSITNPEGAVKSYTYNVSGKPIKTTDYDGGVLSVDYNAMGKPEKLTDKEGRETKLSYDPAGNLSEEVSPTGAVSTFKYDRNNRMVQVSLTASGQEGEAARVVDYTYDPVGNLLKEEAGDGSKAFAVTSYEYDALNRVIAVINPAGGKTAYTYDRKTGKVSSIRDAAGNLHTFCYNEMGELTSETDIKGNITRYEYNALGKITSVTDGAGRTTRYDYLPGGRRDKTVYPDGRQMTYEYDSLGRLKKKTDQNGYGISYTYDSMGRVLSVISSTGQKKSYTYDVAGNVTSITDADGNTTKYAYTLSGKLKEVTDALGNRTEYAYDKADNLIYICQHGKAGETDRITEYERDAFGQVGCIRDALGGEEHFRYDALGRMTEKIDKEGFVTAYTYTADSKPESILYGDGSKAEFTYNPLRQLETVRDWLGETKIERDIQGNPTCITDHEGRTIRYEWGSMGERKGMTYPDGTKVVWNYDSLLHLTEMRRIAKERDTLQISYKYDGQGRISEKNSSGGYRTRWSYNETGSLNELVHEDASGILDRFCYTYDAMGNKTAIRKERRGIPEESGSYRYIYDELQRLTGVEKDGKPLRSYRYDSFGNRIGMEDYERGVRNTSDYDALNRLLSQEIWEGCDIASGYLTGENVSDTNNVMHKTYTYDKRGNLTGEYLNGGMLHGYAFNSMNRLAKAWSGQGEESEYLYNSLGQRMGRYSNGEKENYLLDLTKPYYNLLGVEKEAQKQIFYWDFDVIALERDDGKIQYYLQDELGSSLRVLHRNGHGDTYGYDEFGMDLYNPEKEHNFKRKYSKQGKNQPFGFTGYRYDNISGTYFAQAREYHSMSGRFASEDMIRGKIVVPKTLNRYGYCWGNPMGYVDLNGKDPTPQDMRNMAWDYLMDEVSKAVNEIEYEIRSGIVDVVEDVRDKLSQNNGTLTAKVSVNANAFFGAYIDIGFSFDWKGNVALQWNYAALGVNDTVSLGTLNIGIGLGLAFTEAEDVDKLLGPSSSAGISIGSFALDGISFEDVSDMNGDFDGFQIGVGAGLAPFDIHLVETYANENFEINIFDEILKWLGVRNINGDSSSNGCISTN